ncbi:MAG: Holliday junction resolvase RuvX [Fimbriimonas sp.]
MRLLGIDFGFKRIGLAVAESEAGFATPRLPFAASGALKRDADALHQLARKEGADAIVLGYPLGDEGEAGRMARIVRTLKEHLEALGNQVHLVDESLSSVEAEGVMLEAGLKASERKKRRDGEAACRILERFMSGGQ